MTLVEVLGVLTAVYSSVPSPFFSDVDVCIDRTSGLSVIIVGIDSVAREYELLPYRDPFFTPDSPEPIGRRFPDFLAHDVVPTIAKRYRVASALQVGADLSVVKRRVLIERDGLHVR